MTDFVWAIDPQISYMAFAYASLDDPRHVDVETLTLDTEAREGQRLGWLDRQIRGYARTAARTYPPCCIWVEQPSGHQRIPQLMYAVGVLQAALYETLAAPVWTIPSGTWKKRTVGHGNASKEQVATWVSGRNLGFNSQDECDAVAIAVAGRAMFTTRSWDAAA